MQKEFNKVKPYVYWIKNNITGIKYIGVRWLNVKLNKTPVQDFGKTYFSSGKLKNDFKKNPDNFKTKLIATFNNKEEAQEYELKQTKKIYKNKRYANTASHPAIINKPGSVSSFKGRQHSKETIKKMSVVKKGKKHTEKTKRKMSIVQKGKKQPEEAVRKVAEFHRGRKRSEETKRKMSIAGKGRIPWNKGKKMTKPRKRHSEESIRKVAEFHRGRKRSEESKRKMSIAGKGRIPWNKGKKHSEETKKKISLKLKEIKRGPRGPYKKKR